MKSQILHRRGRALCDMCCTDRSSIAATPSSAASTPSIPKRSRPRRDASPASILPGGIGVRVDTAAYADGVIPPYYDSLVAKLIVRGKDREEAIARMRARSRCSSSKASTPSIPLHRRILADPDFRAGNFDTKFIGRLLGPGKTRGGP